MPEIDPGDIVTVETLDAFSGAIKTEQNKPFEKLKFPFLNPQSGPVAVRGAVQGDTLAVHIISIETCGAQPTGTTCLVPEFGGLVGTGVTALLNQPLPERVRKLRIDEQGVHWNARIVLPYKPLSAQSGCRRGSRRLESVTAFCDAQVDHCGGEMGEAHPATARLVASQRKAGGVLEAREQVLDAVTPGVEPGVPRRRVDHAPLGRVWAVQPTAARLARNVAET